MSLPLQVTVLLLKTHLNRASKTTSIERVRINRTRQCLWTRIILRVSFLLDGKRDGSWCAFAYSPSRHKEIKNALQNFLILCVISRWFPLQATSKAKYVYRKREFCWRTREWLNKCETYALVWWCLRRVRRKWKGHFSFNEEKQIEGVSYLDVQTRDKAEVISF